MTAEGRGKTARRIGFGPVIAWTARRLRSARCSARRATCGSAFQRTSRHLAGSGRRDSQVKARKQACRTARRMSGRQVSEPTEANGNFMHPRVGRIQATGSGRHEAVPQGAARAGPASEPDAMDATLARTHRGHRGQLRWRWSRGRQRHEARHHVAAEASAPNRGRSRTQRTRIRSGTRCSLAGCLEVTPRSSRAPDGVAGWRWPALREKLGGRAWTPRARAG